MILNAKPVSFRDLTLIDLDNQEVLVIACDSLGGIGPKINDKVKTSGEILGIFTSRVPLMEVIAAGAKPIAITNTLSVEMEPTGAEIIKGIIKEVQSGGLKEDMIINGSTEENIVTTQSGLGVTVIGKAFKNELRLGKSEAGDLIVCIGKPKIGDEVLDGTKNADLQVLKKIMELSIVKEVLPVGSKGIKYEAEQLALGANGNLRLISNQEIDIVKSAGPSTCLLATLAEEYLPELIEKVELPIYKIGYIE